MKNSQRLFYVSLGFIFLLSFPFSPGRGWGAVDTGNGQFRDGRRQEPQDILIAQVASTEDSLEDLGGILKSKEIEIENLISEKDYLRQELNKMIKKKESLEKEIMSLQWKLQHTDVYSFENEAKIKELTLQKKSLINQVMTIRQGKISLQNDLKIFRDRLKDNELSLQFQLHEARVPLEQKIE